MKVFLFIYEMFKKFPFLMMVNLLLLMLVNIFNIGSLFTIGPLVDFVVHPDLQNISPLTEKAIYVISFFSLPVNLSSWLIVFIIFILLATIFQVISEYVVQKTRFKIMEAVVADSLDSILKAKWQFFVGQRQGEFINLFSRELNVFGSSLGGIALLIVGVIQIFFFLIVPFYISWKVTTICFLAISIFSIPFIVFGKYGYECGAIGTASSKNFIAHLNENFSLMKIVLGFANQKKCIDSLKNAYSEYANITIRWLTIGNALFLLFRPVAVIVIAIALFFSRKFQVPISEISVLLLSLFQVAKTVGNCVNWKNSLENFFPSYEQIKLIKEQADSNKQLTGTKKFDNFQDSIKIKDLYFAYSGTRYVLKKINMTISRGQMIALVGKSGSGKSTLIDMIMGFNEPQKGVITLDGVDLRELDINSYRTRIGYVPQESILFNKEIKENLLWAKTGASCEEIKEACRLAHADEFINDFPLGYDTFVGDRGVRLSGGQLQRIALARAFLRKPFLLILDEATSSLDSHSEQLIQDAIDQFASKTTVVVIAHRLSTVKKANCIYVLDKGEIVEQGKYDELINSKGVFTSMVELQELRQE